MLTSGISAEYGRFSGGVINAITKSGGNIFSGSFRTNLHNPAWRDETPFEDENDIDTPDKLEPDLRGDARRPDRAATGCGSSPRAAGSAPRPTQPLPQTGHRRSTGRQRDKRGEVKLTGTLAKNHTLQGSYLHNSLDAAIASTFGVHDRPEHAAIIAEPPERPLRGRTIAACCAERCSPRPRSRSKKLRLPQQRRHRDRTSVDSPFITRHAGPRPLQRAVLRRDRSRGSRTTGSSPAALSYFLTTHERRQPRHQGRLRASSRATNTGGNSQSRDQLRVRRRLPRRRRRAIPCYDAQRPADSGVRAGRDAPRELAGRRAARRSTSRRRRSTCRISWALGQHVVARPRPPLRARPQRCHRRHRRRRHRHDRAAAGGDRSTRSATASWSSQATYAHYAGKYSEAQFAQQHQRRQPEPDVCGVYIGPAGPGARLRARLRSGELRRRARRASRPRTCSSRTACRRRSRASSRRRSASQFGRGLREGHLRLSHCSTTSSRTSSTSTPAATDVTYEGERLRDLREQRLRQHRRPRAALPGARSSRAATA